MAVPLAPAGASLLIIDGRVASSRLKAVKKASSQAPRATRPEPARPSPTRLRVMVAMAPRHISFILRFFSATITSGTMATKDSPITTR